MPRESTKFTILGTLGRPTLHAIADGEGIALADRRALDPMRRALSQKRTLSLETLLTYLSRDELKATCRALGLDDSGRSKELIQSRILEGSAASPPARQEPSPQTAPARRNRVTNKPPQNGTSAKKLTLQQLERHLFGAADILRGKMDASEFKEYIFGMLFLKRCSDEFEARREDIIREQLAKGRPPKEAERRAADAAYFRDTFFVPERARWSYIRDELFKNVGDGLNKALGALSESNVGLEGVVHHIDFTRTVGKSRLDDKKLLELIKHFNSVRLRNDDFEFPDLLGAAYEYLIGEFADSAGKKGGEFYTPRSVVRMMVRLGKPKEGMRIYDPCSGSGGMLILSAEYVADHGGDARNLALYGQESNGGVWSISKMNMILHGIKDAQLENGDTLVNPMHKEAGGELSRFDLVLSNPPFSQNYSAEGIPFPERFAYGWCPETGKKADLMFVQHMVAVLRQGGTVCTVMPHGVLFRGGTEKEIRAGFIKHDLLEAVIGLASNLFYGTGIPACILVLRAKGAKPATRRNKVLFINADAEYRAGRAQNFLEHEHIEKIVNAFESYEDIPSFARVVSRDELAENEYNLNIRRYADNAPPPEPHDVRAHLLGGVPRAEVEAHAAMFEAHGFDPMTLLVARDAGYFDFRNDLDNMRQLRAQIEADHGVQARENALAAAFETWWTKNRTHLVELPESGELSCVRKDLLESFCGALVPVGLLDRFKVAGVVASWWGEVVFDLKTLAARGFEGLMESWVDSVVSSMDAEKSKFDPLDHKLVKRLLPELVEQIAEAEARVAELDGTIRAASRAEEDENGEIADGEDGDESLSEEEIAALKKQLAEAKKAVKVLRTSFMERLQVARDELSAAETRELTLGILKADLTRELEQDASANRRAVVGVVESWWHKYGVPLRSIEKERDVARGRMEAFVAELGYAQ